jgi:hypothetical protein|tara:strand:+ start:773 stop:2341 length:1569 start_codon:yes stop_codon:yes gene_type:complete
MIFQIYKTLRIIIFLLILGISFYSVKFYEGSIFIYISYFLSLIAMLFYLTDKKSSYFEIFFSAYLFLGFWFKYVFSLILYEGRIYDSNVAQIKSTDIDDILILGIMIALTCLLSSFMNKKFKKKKNIQSQKDLEKTFFVDLYLQNRVKVLIIFLLSIVTVAFFNSKLGIHQRGFIFDTELPLIIINLVKWLLLFGFTTFSCFIFHVEIKNLKKINSFTMIIIFFEIFSSYTSMLSRSFIINSSSLMLPIYQESSKLIKKYDIKLIVLFIFILLLTAISVLGVNKIRIEKVKTVIIEYKELTENNLNKSNSDIIVEKKLNNYNFQIPKNNSPTDKIEKEVEKTFKTRNSTAIINKTTPKDVVNFILVNRWIGIDSLILVSSSKKKGFDLFFRALKEEKDHLDYTFYEREFGLIDVKTNVDTGKTVMKGNTLPGIISFLYYTGSPVFLLFSIMLIFFIFNFIENFLKHLTNNNLLFMCFISNMIATRLFHFGYAPKDSYLFLISIFLSILFLILLMRFKFRFSR